ncbi:response regulator [Enterococcus sp. OL5]|uniref:response regulator n=1 Tax=Enterococcus sp. OL5 TaxID=2590214 RepID=UPI001125EE81|nr:response regulator [Enterococcus sp. OL5]TPR56876.1 response regulator [Enterococcus sp. OL5]
MIYVGIVDDEVSAREKLKNLLEDIGYVEIVFNVSSPSEALNKLDQVFVDVLFVDMNMPEMDGPIFIARVQQHNEVKKFISVSGYEDFEYAKRCIELGVHKYILKHELTLELLESLLKDLNFGEIKKNEIDRTSIKREIFNHKDLAERDYQNLIQVINPVLVNTNLVAIVFNLDFPKGIYSDQKILERNISGFKEIIGQIIASRYPYIEYFYKENRRYVLLLSFEKNKEYSVIDSQVHSIIMKVSKSAKRLLSTEVRGYSSDIVHHYEDVFKFILDDKRFEEWRFYLNDSPNNRRDVYDKEFDLSVFNEKIIRIHEYLALGQLEIGMADLEKTLASLGEQRLSKARLYEVIRNIIEQYNVLLKILDLDLPQLKMSKQDFLKEDSFYRVKEALVNHYEVIVNCLDEVSFSDAMIQAAVKYILDHLAEPISLEDCANTLYVNYTHLSRTFKRVTGSSFKQYVNHSKMIRAQILLGFQDISIRQVAESVGINGYPYFFKMFKDYTDISPKEFRTKLLGEMYKQEYSTYEKEQIKIIQNKGEMTK